MNPTTQGINALFQELEATAPNAPGHRKNSGSWVLCNGSFYFSLQRCRGMVVLTDVWVPYNRRGLGFGRVGMWRLCRLLDKHGVAAKLRTRAFDRKGGGIPGRKLAEFYGKFGFKRNPEKPSDYYLYRAGVVL